jgi:hypothetical protein
MLPPKAWPPANRLTDACITSSHSCLVLSEYWLPYAPLNGYSMALRFRQRRFSLQYSVSAWHFYASEKLAPHAKATDL